MSGVRGRSRDWTDACALIDYPGRAGRCGGDGGDECGVVGGDRLTSLSLCRREKNRLPLLSTYLNQTSRISTTVSCMLTPPTPYIYTWTRDILPPYPILSYPVNMNVL